MKLKLSQFPLDVDFSVVVEQAKKGDIKWLDFLRRADVSNHTATLRHVRQSNPSEKPYIEFLQGLSYHDQQNNYWMRGCLERAVNEIPRVATRVHGIFATSFALCLGPDHWDYQYWLGEAIKLGDPLAMVHKARLFPYASPDAISLYEKALAAGEPEAMIELGCLKLQKIAGQKYDPLGALQLFYEAAKKGYPEKFAHLINVEATLHGLQNSETYSKYIYALYLLNRGVKRNENHADQYVVHRTDHPTMQFLSDEIIKLLEEGDLNKNEFLFLNKKLMEPPAKWVKRISRALTLGCITWEDVVSDKLSTTHVNNAKEMAVTMLSSLLDESSAGTLPSCITFGAIHTLFQDIAKREDGISKLTIEAYKKWVGDHELKLQVSSLDNARRLVCLEELQTLNFPHVAEVLVKCYEIEAVRYITLLNKRHGDKAKNLEKVIAYAAKGNQRAKKYVSDHFYRQGEEWQQLALKGDKAALQNLEKNQQYPEIKYWYARYYEEQPEKLGILKSLYSIKAFAIRCYRELGEQGFAEGHHRLGQCYENGISVEKDHSLAFYHYYRAVRLGSAGAFTQLKIAGYNTDSPELAALANFYQALQTGYEGMVMILEYAIGLDKTAVIAGKILEIWSNSEYDIHTRLALLQFGKSRKLFSKDVTSCMDKLLLESFALYQKDSQGFPTFLKGFYAYIDPAYFVDFVLTYFEYPNVDLRLRVMLLEFAKQLSISVQERFAVEAKLKLIVSPMLQEVQQWFPSAPPPDLNAQGLNTEEIDEKGVKETVADRIKKLWEEVKEAGFNELKEDFPKEFEDPIARTFMIDPVRVSTDVVYNRDTIPKLNGFCHIRRQNISSSPPFDAIDLRNRMITWLEDKLRELKTKTVDVKILAQSQSAVLGGVVNQDEVDEKGTANDPPLNDGAPDIHNSALKQ